MNCSTSSRAPFPIDGARRARRSIGLRGLSMVSDEVPHRAAIPGPWQAGRQLVTMFPIPGRNQNSASLFTRPDFIHPWSNC